MDSSALVSIGVPVYNGEKYIRWTLESLLAQSYENFELNISDNASTDGTEEICRSYLAKDNRVRYHRNPQNVGLIGNWRRVLQLASGEYFIWAACDDCWSINYIETLLECLLTYPNAILAAGKTLYIDGDGNPRNTDPDDAPVRYKANLGIAKQLLQQHAAGWLHGLYRKNALLRLAPTFFTGDPWGADIVFLLEVCLRSEVVGSDNAIMYKRVAGGKGPRTPREQVHWQCWYAWALMRVILKSSLSAYEKKELLKISAFYLGRRYFRGGINSWVKTWVRAGGQWLMGVDRP
jgi:glycosyltransferase involved in cell wall biosynthesis